MMMGGLYMALMMGAAGLGTASAFSPPGPPATSAQDRSASFPSIGNGASFFSAPLSSRPQIKRASTSSLNAAFIASAAASVATNVNPLFSFLTLPASLTPLYAALSALAATIAGGLFSGSLHAVAGPDHLAALIPRCCGLRWHRAARVGAVWGCGHGVSATLLGVAGFAFKRQIMGGGGAVNQDLLEGASSVMEIAIGVSLVVIGLLGIKEAGEWKVDENVEVGESGELAANSCDAVLSEANSANSAVPNPAKRAVLFNGLLHGFSWDGAPSLAPALAVATWRGSLAFLGAYAVGTALAMTVATAAIGELTFKAGRALDRPDLPRVLSRVSSSVAVLVGLVWVGLALR